MHHTFSFIFLSKEIKTDFQDNGLKEQSKGFSKLPFFASDSSEYFLSSLIERSHDSTDLYLTSFLLCHFMLTPKPFGHKVHAERVSKATANVISYIYLS